MKKRKGKQSGLTYEEQLQDERWLDLRNEVINHRGRCCEACGDMRERLHVHHTIYKPGAMAWEYDKSELVCLCQPCHEDFHKAIKWLSKEISELHPATFLQGLKGNAFKIADTIAEISGRLAQLSWLKIREVPL